MAAAKKTSYGQSGMSTPEWKMVRPDVKPFTQDGILRDYNRLFWEAEYYVHNEVTDKVLAKEFVKYCQKNFDRKEAALLRKLPDWRFVGIGAKWTYIVSKGGVLDDDRAQRLETLYNDLLEQAKEVDQQEKTQAKTDAAQPKAPVISIQDRMKEQIADLLGNLEAAIDKHLDGDLKANDFDPYGIIQNYEVEIKPAHAKLIREFFEPQLAEAQEIVDWKNDDIREAYAHLSTAKSRKEFCEFYTKIITACDTVINTGKAVRKPRKAKAPSKEKLVSKVKYCESDPQTGLASINPVSIVDAKILWVYNTKNRKLGVYVADEHLGSLSVKGTTITGFDPAQSCQKTIRKPEETIKGAGKLARTKIQKVFDQVKATETKLNGRLNEHTILVRVF